VITKQQQEQAALSALGLMSAEEQREFAAQVRANTELRDFLHELQRTLDAVALSVPAAPVPAGLKAKVLDKVATKATAATSPGRSRAPALPSGFRFLSADDPAGWKQLPVPGAWIKLLSFEPSRGYAVLAGKLDPGVRYPAHINAGPEDVYILTGDLHIGERVLGPGDFHHADAGSAHGENYSLQGCTLLAVLTVDDPLVSFAMA
jgi:anti-sigma factor ChrR (cupin superfamily)